MKVPCEKKKKKKKKKQQWVQTKGTCEKNNIDYRIHKLSLRSVCGVFLPIVIAISGSVLKLVSL